MRALLSGGKGGLCCVAALLLLQSALGQSTNVHFERVPLDLSNNSVRAIFQDHEGYLWFGTYEGLNRWDGFEVVTYKHDPLDSTSLADNEITDILEDGENRLWVGTMKGVHILDRVKQRFRRIPTDATFPFTRGVMLRLDSGRRVWLVAEFSIHVFDSFSRALQPVWQGDKTPAAVVVDDTGTLHFSKYDGTIHRLKRGESAPEQVDSLGTERIIHAMARSEAGTLWAATRLDAGVIDRVTGRYVPKISFPKTIPQEPTRIAFDREGGVWISAPTYGLYRFDPDSATFLEISVAERWANPLASNVADVYVDQTGTVWAGTLGGVYRYNSAQRRFRFVGRGDGQALRTPAVVGIYEDPDSVGVVWVSTIEGGLHRIEVSTGAVRYFPLLPHSHLSTAWTVVGGRDGNLWLAWRGGLLRFDRRTGRSEFIDDGRTESFLPAEVGPLIADGGGGFWVGRTSGEKLLHFNPHTSTFTTHVDGHRPSISALHRNELGIWFGTRTAGLGRYDPDTQELFSYPHGSPNSNALAGRHVWTIHESKDGTLWVGTTSGLSRFDPVTETFTNYYERDGLPGAVVYSILEDGDDRLWLGTNHGLASFDPTTETFRVYDEADGLGNTEFNRRAAFRGVDGTMYFGGTNGLTWFHPGQIAENAYVPPVVLTSIRTVQRDRTDEIAPYGRREIRIQQGTSTFSFEFAALDFFNPAKTRYRYRLDGFDEGWVDSGAHRFATYTNIPPGRYTFQVKGANGDGLWNEEGAAIRVTVLPYFWQTAWFSVLMVLAFASFLYGAYRYRVKQLLELERLRLRIAGDLHDDIGSNLSSIALISDVVARRTILTDTERRQLQVVGRTAREMTDALREIVWLTRPGRDDLDDLLARMEDTASVLLNGSSHSFRWLGKGDGRNLPMSYRRNVFLIYKEILHNIARHSGARHIEILIRIDDEAIELLVMDDGAGFDATANGRPDVANRDAKSSTSLGKASSNGNDASTNGSGLGLGSLRRRAAEIGGRLTLDTAPGKGTSVMLRAALPRPWYAKYQAQVMRLARIVSRLRPGSNPPARHSPQSAETSEARP